MWCLFYRRIITTIWPRVTAQYPPGRQRNAFDKTVVIKAITRILGACWHVFTACAQIWAYYYLIKPNEFSCSNVENAHLNKLHYPRTKEIFFFFSEPAAPLFKPLDCAAQTRLRTILLRRFRSTALLTSFLATASPKSGLALFATSPEYRPQYTFVLGRVLSNSEILVLFNY